MHPKDFKGLCKFLIQFRGCGAPGWRSAGAVTVAARRSSNHNMWTILIQPQHVNAQVCVREKVCVRVRAYFATMLLALAQPRLAGAIARSAAQPRQLARNSAAPDAK